jgi:hypothetical protein
MEFPFDVLDYIFSFLKSDPESLVACSRAHPLLSRIVERYLYYHIVILTGIGFQNTGQGYFLESSHLIKILSETPQIVDYVRVLQIAFSYFNNSTQETRRRLEEIALILPMFPALECITLSTDGPMSWQEELPQSFRTAVDDCLHLQTLQKLCAGVLHFPLSMLDNHPHVTCLSIDTAPHVPDCLESTYPQLKFLSVVNLDDAYVVSFSNWAKQHIGKLESLKCEISDYSSERMVSEFLEICSDTLTCLDICLDGPSFPCELLYVLFWDHLALI